MADETKMELKCRHLCSKIVSTEAISSAFDLPAGHYWCLQTMAEAGPDDDVCDGDMCKPGRDCFEPEIDV